MKTEIKKLDGIKREINIEVSGDIVKNKFKDVFERVSKEAKVPGFRPGKAPADIIQKQYGSAIREHVLQELVPDIYNEAINKENLDVIELPQISEVKLLQDALSFKALVEVSPEIIVENYKNLKINFKKASVSEEEIKQSLNALKEQHKAQEVDDKFAKSLGYPNLAELEKVIEKQLFMNKENQERLRVENEIIESIMKGLDFKAPQSLLKRQLDEMLKQAKVDLALRGVPKGTIEAQSKTLLEKLEPQARQQVRTYLVLSGIAKKENIPIDDNMSRRVIEFLLREADWTAG